jgi:hypothetical protein
MPLDQQLDAFAVQLPPKIVSQPPAMQPLSNKPVFFDVAYNLIADRFPVDALQQRISALGGKMVVEPPRRNEQTPPVSATGAELEQQSQQQQQQQGISGLLGSWWAGRK